MKCRSLILFLFPLTLYGDPELLDAEHAEIPFAGEPFSGEARGITPYSLVVKRQNRSVSAKVIRGEDVICSMELPASMDIYSVFWHESQCWFVIRKFNGVGSNVISLVSFDPSKNQNEFIFYGVEVSNGAGGQIFCLDGASPVGVMARCGIVRVGHPNKKIDFKTGLIKAKDLIELKEEQLKALMIPVPGDDGPRALERQAE